MNFNRNTRISILITLFALVAVLTIFVYLNSDRDSNKTETTEAANEIAFLSNTPQISASTTNAQAYHGIQTASDILDKKCNSYFISSKGSSLQATISTEETNSAGIHNETLYDTDAPVSIDTTEYPELIRQAVNDGAKLIICPDSTYSETIYNVQNNYLNTYFILVDGVPHNPDHSDQSINYNVIPLNYDEAEIGFFAGYSLVYEGYHSLAFIGSKGRTDMIRYGYGFLQGANLAAAECNVANVDISYHYAENSDDAVNTAGKYYSSGIKVIVTAGDDIAAALHDTAVRHDSYLVSCGNFYNSLEDGSQLIALAAKNISSSVEDTIVGFYAGDVSGGKVFTFDSTNNGINYLFDTNRFSKFNTEVYNDIYYRLTDNSITLISDTTVSTEDLGLTHVTLKDIE